MRKQCLTMPRTEKIRVTLFQPIKAWKKPRIILLSSTWPIPLGRWGIELKSNGKFIGTIDLHKIDPALKKAAIGYIINKKYWNQGLTTEANRAVIELAFEKIGMNKLTALHDKANPASGKVMEKSGMHFSHEEAYACMDQNEEGRIVTRVHYVLTKEDYFANK